MLALNDALCSINRGIEGDFQGRGGNYFHGQITQ